ncbi:MAG: hypothetical protein HC771_14835 [Synechococcales cyanobacterium CRU_2_2]|nr:hypothetical protein [Synechococcales cyanobacterium CRU_2_2]
MAKHTQAHLSRRILKSKGMDPMTKRQIEYYMGAKLIEIGIEPKSAIYRWSQADKGMQIEWTYSAYWGDSKKEVLMNEGNL